MIEKFDSSDYDGGINRSTKGSTDGRNNYRRSNDDDDFEGRDSSTSPRKRLIDSRLDWDSNETLLHSNVSYSTELSYRTRALLSSSSSEAVSKVWICESKDSLGSEILSEETSIYPHDSLHSASEGDKEPDIDKNLTLCGFEVIPIDEEICSFNDTFQDNGNTHDENALRNQCKRQMKSAMFVQSSTSEFHNESSNITKKGQMQSIPSNCSSNIISMNSSPKSYKKPESVPATKDGDLSKIRIRPQLSVDLNDDNISVISRNSSVPDELESPQKKNSSPEAQNCSCFFVENNKGTLGKTSNLSSSFPTKSDQGKIHDGGTKKYSKSYVPLHGVSTKYESSKGSSTSIEKSSLGRSRSYQIQDKVKISSSRKSRKGNCMRRNRTVSKISTKVSI